MIPITVPYSDKPSKFLFGFPFAKLSDKSTQKCVLYKLNGQIFISFKALHTYIKGLDFSLICGCYFQKNSSYLIDYVEF